MGDEAIGLDARLQESERPTARRAVLSANGAHILHDGLTDVLYVFFPIWQGSLGLDYSAIGALKAPPRYSER